MKKTTTSVLCSILILSGYIVCLGDDANTIGSNLELIKYENEFSRVHVEPARMNGKGGLAVIFEGTEGLHYYANKDTAPAVGYQLKVEAKSDNVEFAEAVFPRWTFFFDKGLGKNIEVYTGNFTIFAPLNPQQLPAKQMFLC